MRRAALLALALVLSVLPGFAQKSPYGLAAARRAPIAHVYKTPATHVTKLPKPKPLKVTPYKAPSLRSSPKCLSCARTPAGKIKRSAAAKSSFERQTGFPHGRPGYVVDHVRPLACGGADAPSNMQWQTKAAAAAKDKTERKGCQ